MFRILIVEDQQDKLKNILQTLEKIEGINSEIIDTVIDANDAKSFLLRQQYDLLILDISIPLRKSQEIVADGGLILLKEIIQRNKYKTPTHIIGLTSHDNIFQKAREQFEEEVLTVIKYDITNTTWQTLLTNGVQHRIVAKEDSQKQSPNYEYDLAIICALKIELDANKANGWSWTLLINEDDDTVYYQTVIKDKNGKDLKIIAASAPRMGMSFSASLSMKVITKFKPKFLLMTGIMAGVKDKVNLGDIVVANPIWDWGSGKWIPNLKEPQKLKSEFADLKNIEEDENEFRKSIFQIDPYQYTRNTLFTRPITLISDDKLYLYNLRANFPRIAPNHDVRLLEGPVASGASVLADKNILNDIKKEQHRKLLGVEMEAYGLFCAAENSPKPKPTALCIKSVVDFGDFEKVDDFQDFGCYASAMIAKRIFEQILEIET
jgi:nucleoside phosphorylase